MIFSFPLSELFLCFHYPISKTSTVHQMIFLLGLVNFTNLLRLRVHIRNAAAMLKFISYGEILQNPKLVQIRLSVFHKI